MDTTTGRVVELNNADAILAASNWVAWEAGILKELPRYAPIKGDKTLVRSVRQKIKRSK